MVFASEKTKAEAQRGRQHKEEDLLLMTKELRELIAMRRSVPVDSANQSTVYTLRDLGEPLARLGLFDEIDVLATQIRELSQHVTSTKQRRWLGKFDFRRLKVRMLTARREYDQAVAISNGWKDDYVAIRGAIVQGDLDDAFTLIENSVGSDADFSQRRFLIGSAAWLAMTAHWLGREKMVDSALNWLRILIEEKPDSTRQLDDASALPSSDEPEVLAYFVLTLANIGRGEIAEELVKAHDLQTRCKGFLNIFEQLAYRLEVAGDALRGWKLRDSLNRSPDDDWEAVLAPLASRSAACLDALIRSDLPAASHRTEELLELAIKLVLPEDGPRWTDPQKGLFRLQKSLDTLQKFSVDLHSFGQRELERRVFQTYSKLVDLLPVLFEEPVSWHRWREWHRDLLRYDDQRQVSRFAGAVPDVEIHRLADQLSQLLYGDRPDVSPEDWRSFTRWEIAKVRIGMIPEGLEVLYPDERRDAIRAMIDNGHADAAAPLYQTLVEDAQRQISEDQKDYWVVNTRIWNARKAITELAAYFDDLQFAVKCAEGLEHLTERKAGYRAIARSLADATDMTNAIEWSLTLPNEFLQLAALVDILRHTTRDLAAPEFLPKTSLLQQIKRVDDPYLITPGGC